ncbi:hypothetical protein C0Q70_20476 [Pomacea canaliculata]|uniref:Uncharacterized protein n=2 Tax=Pomacea canaliculata TaxID=400727 RepID=A0A2T7NFS6_POMCA|nr:hypothetical protein C0Q70_20476 [Pomacea canaliculata]
MRGRGGGSGERLPPVVYHQQASGQHQEHFVSDCDPRRPISQASPPPPPPPPDGAYTVHVADSHHPARAGSDSPRSGRSSGSQNVPSSHALPSSQQTRTVSYSRSTHTLPVLPGPVRQRRRLSDPEWGLRQHQEMTEPLLRTSSGSSQERRGRTHERGQRPAAFPPEATHGLHSGSHSLRPPNYVSLPGTEGQVSGVQTAGGSKGQCVPSGSFTASAGVYAAPPGHSAKSAPYPAQPRREHHGYDTSGYGDHQPATHPPTSGSDPRKCAAPLGYRGSYTNSVDQDYSQFRIPRHPASSAEVNPPRVQSPPPPSYPERVSSPPPPSPYSMQPPSPRQHPTRPVSPPPYSIICPVSPHHPSSHGVQEPPPASRSAVESRVAATSQQYIVPDIQQQQTARGQAYPVTYRRSSKEHVFVGHRLHLLLAWKHSSSGGTGYLSTARIYPCMEVRPTFSQVLPSFLP